MEATIISFIICDLLHTVCLWWSGFMLFIVIIYLELSRNASSSILNKTARLRCTVWTLTPDTKRKSISCKFMIRTLETIPGWWFGPWTLWLSISWECRNGIIIPIWRTPSFFGGVGIPPIRFACIVLLLSYREWVTLLGTVGFRFEDDKHCMQLCMLWLNFWDMFIFFPNCPSTSSGSKSFGCFACHHFGRGQKQ